MVLEATPPHGLLPSSCPHPPQERHLGTEHFRTSLIVQAFDVMSEPRDRTLISFAALLGGAPERLEDDGARMTAQNVLNFFVLKLAVKHKS